MLTGVYYESGLLLVCVEVEDAAVGLEEGAISAHWYWEG